MNVVDTQIREEGGNTPAFRVEFSGDGGEVISIFMRQTGDVSRDNVIAKARALMIQIGATEDQNDYRHTYERESNGDVSP